MGHLWRQQPRANCGKLLPGDRFAFNVRKNFPTELLKNGGGELFTTENINLEILKNHPSKMF